jgi:hypothetical protein
MNNIKSPLFVGARRANQFYSNRDFTRKRRSRKFERSLLPTPASYYSKVFPNLKIKSEWVKVRCCFHNDSTPSLSINMVDGHFRCFGCNAKGGDVLAFHMLLHKFNFIEAVNDFGAWNYE